MLRIAVRATEAAAARAARARLAAAGFEADASGRGDILIAVAGADAMEIAARAMDSEAASMACLLGVMSGPAPVGGAPAPFLGAVALDAPPSLLRAQIEAWSRVAIGREERERRAATAAAFGAPAPRPYAVRTAKALYVGAPNAMFLVLQAALAAEDVALSAALSVNGGFDHLHDDVFDAVILNGAEDARAALSLCSALRRNSALFDVPAMLVAARGDDAAAAQAIERGVCAILEINADHDQPIQWLLQAMRREQLRRAIEHDLRAHRDVMGELRTGLWRADAFTQHLDRMALDHNHNGRAMSLAVMRVMPAHGASAPSAEMWKRAFSEVATLAGRLAREADCVVALGVDLIAVALPAAGEQAASRTCARIASVVECTAFVSSADAAPLVFEQGAAALRSGESGRALLTRALGAIDVERIPA